MSEVILLVGPPGCGKTTYCDKYLSSYTRISQDEMGKTDHLRLYKEALGRGDNIVVDRINHTRAQRARYLELADNHKKKIVALNEPYGVCLERLQNRSEHPTLSNSNPEAISKALDMYFKEYQYPLDEEADEIIRSDYDPYLLDLTGIYDQALIIGDLHGCADEFHELWKQYYKERHYDSPKTCIILSGDIIDRGPRIPDCVRLIKYDQHVYSIKGNHEDKFIRYLKGNQIQITHGLSETINQLELESNPEKKDEYKTLFQSLPYIIKFGKNYVVHAGINPERSIIKQSKETLIYVRDLKQSGLKTVMANGESDAEPWYQHYAGRENIFFGHDYKPAVEVQKNVYAMDGHCVHGKELRGAIVNEAGEVLKHYSIPSSFKFERKEDYETDAHSSLMPYEELMQSGYLRKSETQDLVLYGYTDKCTFEKNWNEYTQAARGLIFEKKTGEIVAKPFPKFFNLGEMPETQFKNLPNEPYTVHEKMDGSLGIIFHYKGEWRIATRGSFTSEQALKGVEILKKYDLDRTHKHLTLLVEIIYPDNKIVVDYGDEEKLVLLGIYDRRSQEEVCLSKAEMALYLKQTGLEKPTTYDMTIEQMIEAQKTLPKDQEGFVVRFDSGLRVKIKGDEYMRISRLISKLSPLTLWETMVDGKVDTVYLQELPEEFKDDYESIRVELEKQYLMTYAEIISEVCQAPVVNIQTEQDAKSLGLWLKQSIVKHSPAIFPYVKGNSKALDKYIMKSIRPTGNIMHKES